MGVRVSGVVLRRVESHKDIRLSTQILNGVGDPWKKNKAPCLLVGNNHVFDFASVTKANQ